MRVDGRLLSGIGIGVVIAGAAIVVGGPLNPPTGPVASTYKTISETPTSSPIGDAFTPGDATATFVIRASGRYHLTSDLEGEAGKVGIRIDADSVALDLNGHAVDGLEAGLTGITANGFERIEITDGTVVGWTGSGVRLSSAGSDESVYLTELTCRENGLNGASVDTQQAVITSCVFKNNLGIGLEMEAGIVQSSIAENNGSVGFDINRGRVTGSIARSNAGLGIRTGDSSVIEDNLIAFNGLGGVSVGSFSRVVGNHFDFNGSDAVEPDPTGAAILATFANAITNNSATDHELFVTARPGIIPSEIMVIQNTVSGIDVTDLPVADNTIGPIVTSGNIATSSNPHANYLE